MDQTRTKQTLGETGQKSGQNACGCGETFPSQQELREHEKHCGEESGLKTGNAKGGSGQCSCG